MSHSFVKHDHNVGGLRVHVYSKPDLFSSPGTAESPKEIAALFMLHGRTGSVDDPYIVETAKAAYKLADEQRVLNPSKQQREFIVIGFDHRNHGHRLVDPLGNKSWKADQEANEHNARHAQVSHFLTPLPQSAEVRTQVTEFHSGTARDISFLIDFLPSYLFPNDENTIVTWAVAGISLGGHSTWLALRNDPRIAIGVPVIGCPDYLRLLTFRAQGANIPLLPPYLPSALFSLLRKDDPAAVAFRSSRPAENPFIGKKVLVLSGGADQLVPWDASREFVEGLEVGEAGRKKVVVEKDTGHAYTETMKAELVQFFFEEALVV
ncbi:hypothetical protein EW146_g4015 [Bondarzewia mesenterica]|uniref:Peptidase S9 prolyl oligopeptidase catalytic domain-containing protein n=1 Tax=Bondarzewia mesenterica TaxID=1095465 RepID=A0A4S4LVS2_9AGAM|nr:hypothetical protein EW146_g4015 [Bondarzewia mesenterica]